MNYASSKAGLIGFTRSLAREVASRNVTVNAVAPGYIETPMTAVLDEKQRAVMMVQIPLGRAGTDAEIAQSVAFLASDASRLHHRPRARREWRHVHGRLSLRDLISDSEIRSES